jgi:CelD/BcsL family acetyltransferase involved in cellulose biosynthesis
MLTVSEYSDLSAVVGIRDLWRELWWKTPKASFFQSVEWFERHCRRVANMEQPRVLVVAVAGRPVGLVPWVTKTVRSRFGRMRVLTDSLANHGFFGGPLGFRPALTLQAALNHVQSQSSWDRLELRHVELQDCDDTLGANRLNQSDTHHAIEDSRAIVECQGDWVRYLRSRPNEVREAYRRSEQTLAARGEIEHVRYRPEGAPLFDGAPRWELFNEIERQEIGSRARQAAGAPTAESRDGQVLREMHDAATAIAGVDLNLLRLGGRPIAWAYNYRCDGRIEMQYLHAAEELSSAASCVLLGRMLRDGFRRGDESYLFDRETSRTAAGWQTGRATIRSSNRHASRATRFVRFLPGFSRVGCAG